MISKATYFAIMEAKKDEVFEQTKAALKRHLDVADVSDADLRAMINILNRENAEALVVGIRQAFRDRIVTDFTTIDQEILLNCIKKAFCESKKHTTGAVKSLRGFSQYGKEQGMAIGKSIGSTVTPKLVKLIEGPERGNFENPEAVIQLLKTDALSTL